MVDKDVAYIKAHMSNTLTNASSSLTLVENFSPNAQHILPSDDVDMFVEVNDDHISPPPG